jgi:hypothetical protein
VPSAAPILLTFEPSHHFIQRHTHDRIAFASLDLTLNSPPNRSNFFFLKTKGKFSIREENKRLVTLASYRLMSFLLESISRAGGITSFGIT